MNEQIVLEDDIVKGLLSALSSSERTISMAAANAVLDLSTTSIGRHRLIEFSAIDYLTNAKLSKESVRNTAKAHPTPCTLPSASAKPAPKQRTAPYTSKQSSPPAISPTAVPCSRAPLEKRQFFDFKIMS
ncbi:hypothetical protein LguiB_012504 [Lonicera macranthoides]